MIKQNVLNAGYVRLVEYMGGDKSVIRNARRCWRSEDKSSEKSDRNLIRHLLREGHMTPFEAMVFTFDVKCPIFVARQWMRHRIGSFNEESLRYCVAERDYFIPSGLNQQQLTFWKMYNDEQFDRYNLLKQTMPKEQARSILPLGTYTKFYWTVNGSSLMNFLKLRLDKGAQAEIREYAEAILDMVKTVAPVSFTEFVPLVLED
ncbi:MAG TPA: FAD-dependent thymidylate synthase [Clostridiales bacterium]|nr:FAD-dependent thymidylate synthase [Clostridiales bacterium]